ncbi:MAG TPA: hypothetical protein PLK80_08055 [bacterium]|nr:MAG: hypothetical protein BWY28_02786 [bacterium ADurb.Bin236]HOY61624.1 hypothetical protein [bacterium]HPI76676.1 hypothetical protein [bacterium]
MRAFVEVEDAIVAAIAAAMPELKVASLDDAPASADMLRLPAAFVTRAGMVADDEDSPGCSACEQYWKVYLCAKSASSGKARRGERGIYAMEAAVIGALQDKTLGLGGISGFKVSRSESFMEDDSPEIAGQVLTFVFKEMVD